MKFVACLAAATVAEIGGIARASARIESQFNCGFGIERDEMSGGLVYTRFRG